MSEKTCAFSPGRWLHSTQLLAPWLSAVKQEHSVFIWTSGKLYKEVFPPPFYTTIKLMAWFFGLIPFILQSKSKGYCTKRGKCLKFITSSTYSSLSAAMDAFVLSISRVRVSVLSCLPQCLRQEKHPINQKSVFEQRCLDEIEMACSKFWGFLFPFIASLAYTSVPWPIIYSIWFHI